MSTLHKKSKHHIKSVVLTTFLVFFFISFSKAQINLTDWKINAPSSAKARSNTTFKALPEEAVKASISIADFKRKLQKEPQEIVLPTPDGNYETFLIEPTNVVAKEVAHLYTIKTFRGYKKDDPSVLMACDISDYGFHAAIYAGKHTYFIEPASTNISEVEQHYIYYKHQSKAGKVKCGVTANMHHVQQAVNSVRRNIPDTKRTYRLGIIATGEYSQQFGGTPFSTTNVLNALASGVNIINPIYLRDLGVEFNLVSTASMVFSNPDTDPFDLDDQVEVIELGHTLIVEALGENGFDVGHVVAWENTGGIASLGVVCNDFKGEGFSGSDASVTTLWVDFVAHEIGHQFGAMHNFSSEECEASVDSFRFEPGEGSSIMAYANVCVDSVQYSAGADPYFHYASIKTIQEYIATTNCAITASAGNSNDPVPAAQNNITIPKQTPFVLIGSATDANDLPSSLTYNWLQFDGNGSATTGSPDCNSTTAPLFRYRAPVDVPLRSFPLYSDVIAGNNNAIEWEKLPCTARSMNFVLVARDNNPSFGRVEADSMVVTVADTGPFEVTFPNGGQSFVGNTFNNITWTVNGTDTHCSTVDILLSIDGGETYTVIANATPNDGTQVVAIPNIASSTARILIRCDVAGGFREASTFYDVSNASFAITEGTSFVDADNDGIEASIDCNDNDATVGAQQPVGTACNDGNVNTSNDVILADGCNCAGTIINTPVDNDNDGFNADVDCDDNNATINPAATEFPNNNVDENCDGIILVIDNDNDGQNSSVDCDDNNPNIGPIRAVGTACDDGNPNTVNDVILADGCSCAGTFFDPNPCINNGGDADNDGICANIDCNDNNPTIGAQQTPGTVCNDGNPNTNNDVILADGCSCAGTIINTTTDNDNDGFTSDVDCNDNNPNINPGATEFPNNNVDENCDGIVLIIDNDNDGQNSSVDCDDNNPNIGPIRAVGTACDDGNPTTINDVILADGCSCAGIIFNPNACINNGGDADSDGICADIDCNDNNPTIGATQTPGTACNDGNPNTSNDVILADGCSCAGTPISPNEDNDNDGFNFDVDCNDNNPTINPGAIEVPNNNVDENCDGIALIIDNDNDGQNSSVDCDDNNPNIGPIRAVGTSCDDENPATINDVILGDGCSCAGTIFNPEACINNGGDADNDGICADIDCNDNNPTIGAQQVPGTICNDGNPNTNNDVILADGCNCAGTIINTSIDNDNDGFNSDVDCNDNNPAINPGATEIPGNGIDENCDGIDGMIGTCRVPENIQSEVLSNRTAFLTWDAVPSATSYSVQIRFKGQTRWIITTEVLWNKASIFGPSNRNYEFRVRTNCGDESSAFSDVFEYSTILDFSNSASSRNAANFVADITIADDIAKTIQLTPNPVRDALSLQYSATDKAKITIYHTSGQLIKQTTISKDNSLHPINVSDLEAGLYLLMIEENGNLPITKRFIKIN